MRKIYGYNNNMKKVVGIPPTNYFGYNNSYANSFNNNFGNNFNNRYYRRQKEKQQKNIIKKPGVMQNSTIYKSTDPNIIYFMEYCKVRNTQIYNKLNPYQNINIPNTPASIIDYESKYSSYAKPSKKIETNRAIEAYNQMSKGKSILVDFEARKKAKKTIIKEEKEIPTKKQEMKVFKDKIKNYQKSELDLAAEKFEKALRERNKYDAELRKNGYRVIKGRKNSGFGRD